MILKGRKSVIYILFSAFVWLCVFDAYNQQGMLIHGPYKVKIQNKELILIVREFYDYKEKIWNIQKIPKIKTFSFYENIEVKFDFLNHLSSSSSLPNSLIYFASSPSFNEIKSLEEKIENLLAEQMERVEALSYKEIIMKALEINISSFPNLISEEEKNELLKKAKNSIKKNKKEYWKRFEKVKQDKSIIRKLFDPRKSF